MKYEVEVRANAGYIITVEAESTSEARDEAEDRVRQQLGPAIWVMLDTDSVLSCSW